MGNFRWQYHRMVPQVTKSTSFLTSVHIMGLQGQAYLVTLVVASL